MNIVCVSCAARIQLDDTKVPAHAFSVRCPKCRNLINVPAPAQRTAASVSPQATGELPHAQPTGNPDQQHAMSDAPPSPDQQPAGDRQRFTTPIAAPLFKPNKAEADTTTEAEPKEGTNTEHGELLQALAALLQNGGVVRATATRKARKRRKVLVCVNSSHREEVAAPLAENDYEVYLAADALQALERMRQDQIDIIVLEADFDAKGQGAVFVNRELTTMSPANRRQIFIVQLSIGSRSADPHAAFIHNVNMVARPDELSELPQMLESVTRDYDELYRIFREALANVS